MIKNRRRWFYIITASYTVNGVPIEKTKLKEIKIVRKDYADFIETIKKKVNNFQKKAQS